MDSPKDHGDKTARRLRGKAERGGLSSAEIEQATSLLASDHEATRRQAAEALSAAAGSSEGAVFAAFETLVEHVEPPGDPDDPIVETILSVIEARPVKSAETLAEQITAGGNPERVGNAVWVLAAVAETAPDAVAQVVDDPQLLPVLVNMLSSERQVEWTDSLSLLATAGAVRPRVVLEADAIDALVDRMRSGNEMEREIILEEALVPLAEIEPDVVVEQLIRLVKFSVDEGVQNDAAWGIAGVADIAPESIAAVGDEIVDLLSIDALREPLAVTLLSVAETNPGAVDPFVTELVGLLGHDEPFVREKACLALGHVGREDHLGQLRNLREDPVMEVRVAAMGAMRSIADREGCSLTDRDRELMKEVNVKYHADGDVVTGDKTVHETNVDDTIMNRSNVARKGAGTTESGGTPEHTGNPSAGEPSGETTFCPNCGSRLEESDQTFCHRCGSEL